MSEGDGEERDSFADRVERHLSEPFPWLRAALSTGIGVAVVALLSGEGWTGALVRGGPIIVIALIWFEATRPDPPE